MNRPIAGYLFGAMLISGCLASPQAPPLTPSSPLVWTSPQPSGQQPPLESTPRPIAIVQPTRTFSTPTVASSPNFTPGPSSTASPRPGPSSGSSPGPRPRAEVPPGPGAKPAPAAASSSLARAVSPTPDFRPPQSGPLEVVVEVSQAPRRGGSHSEIVYALLEVKGKKDLPLQAERAFLALALDISASLGGKDLELACRAVAQLFSQSKPGDRASLIVFAARAELLFDRTWENKPGLDEIGAALRKVKINRGDTLLGSGARMALDMLKKDSNFPVKHLILVSDGATRLAYEPESMASEARQFGTSVSCVGVSQRCNHDWLQKVAEVGGGRYYRLEGPEHLPEVIVEEVQRAHGLALRGVELEVELGPEVRFRRIFRPLPLEEFTPRTPRQSSFFLGNLEKGKSIQLLLELEVKPGNQESLELLRVSCQTRRFDDQPYPAQQFPLVIQERVSTARFPAPEIMEIVESIYQKLKGAS